MTRDIAISNQYPNLTFSEENVISAIVALDEFENHPVSEGDLSIAFISDESIASIHDEFMNDNSATDVITFPGDEAMGFAGEICLSIDHAVQASKEHDQTLSEEITLYIVHGYLHLAGLNDLNEDDKKEMRAGEAECMDYLRKLNYIPEFKLSEQ